MLDAIAEAKRRFRETALANCSVYRAEIISAWKRFI
jgi:hypothetical protein